MTTLIYKRGILVASVCSDEPVEDMLASVQAEVGGSPQVAKDAKFATGQDNPCPCERGRGMHYLVEF